VKKEKLLKEKVMVLKHLPPKREQLKKKLPMVKIQLVKLKK
jgi:hypothetical protein